jgi:hypothetical protein
MFVRCRPAPPDLQPCGEKLIRKVSLFATYLLKSASCRARLDAPGSRFQTEGEASKSEEIVAMTGDPGK